MSYHRIIATVGALFVVAAAPLAAQRVTPAPTTPPATVPATSPDSTAGTLQAVVVTAERSRTPRTMTALMRENARLRQVLRMQDRRIGELRTRIAAARAAGEAKQLEIAGIDSATVATRAQRMVLEERLRDAEVRMAQNR